MDRVSYMHDKRVKNKLLTLEHILLCALSLEGVGAEENEINRIGHG